MTELDEKALETAANESMTTDRGDGELEELIAKLDKAAEGNRHLDARIWAAVQPAKGIAFDGYENPNGATYEYDADEDGSVHLYVRFADGAITRRARRPSPHYTTSLDAALTLVPEGDYDQSWCRSTRGQAEGFKLWQVRIALETVAEDPEETGPVALGEHDSLATALSIAALKALHAERSAAVERSETTTPPPSSLSTAERESK